MSGRETNLSRTWRWLPAGVRNAGLNIGRQSAELLAGSRKRVDACARWLELRNKITAYQLFEGQTRAGGLDQLAISGLDTYSRLFAAEGYGYRNASSALKSEMLPELSPIAIHAGVGLKLAEQTLVKINGGERESDSLAEFLTACRLDARESFNGIMVEALGLIARTLYPHLIGQLDKRLRMLNDSSTAYFWHGVGRGIYFVPRNIPPSRAAPWQGLSMCAKEPPHETGKVNAISGFCFALTLVNLRQPEVFEAFFKYHAADAASYMDGMTAALAVAAEDCRQPEHLFSVRSEAKRDFSRNVLCAFARKFS